MNIFKRLAALESQNANLALELAKQTKKTEILEAKLIELTEAFSEVSPELEKQQNELERFEQGVNNILMFSANYKGGDS